MAVRITSRISSGLFQPSCKYPLYGTAPEPTISQRSPLLCATIVTILLVPKSIVGTVIFMNSHTPCFPVWPFCRTAEAGKIAVLTPLYLGFCQPVSRRLFPARQAQSPIQYTIFHYKPFFSGMQVLSGVLNVFRRHFYPIFMFCGADDDSITPSAAHKPDSPRPSASVCRPFCPLPKAPCGRSGTPAASHAAAMNPPAQFPCRPSSASVFCPAS